ncbi:MAG: IreB family regulatory phosphoprotein [Clostridia bacterium]|nr:IreB family regulatory phosphoprotein [Clostridia bacterium]
MQNINDTMKYSRREENTEIKDILIQVFNALQEKGYDPVNQIVGYILSGDPTYITGYNNARNLIRRVDRDELLEELVKSYIANCE